MSDLESLSGSSSGTEDSEHSYAQEPVQYVNWENEPWRQVEVGEHVEDVQQQGERIDVCNMS